MDSFHIQTVRCQRKNFEGSCSDRWLPCTLLSDVPSSGSIVSGFAIDQNSMTRSFAPSKENFTWRPALKWKRNDSSRQGRKVAHVDDTANVLCWTRITSDGKHFSTISKNNRSCFKGYVSAVIGLAGRLASESTSRNSTSCEE